VNLLADKEVPARVGAIRGIADSGDIAGALLLRLKALVGDKEDEVIGECFAGLLRLAPAPSVEFVAGFLKSASEEIRERAALALGESHLAVGTYDVLTSEQRNYQTSRPLCESDILFNTSCRRRKIPKKGTDPP
jgi:hypothetical protein